MSIFSETLVFLRNRANLSREQLAEKIGVSEAHIKRLETAYIAPDEKTLAAIAECFSVTTAYLLGTVSCQITVNEPGFDLTGNFTAVPVLDASAATKNKILESEIIERIIIPTPRNKHSGFVAVLIEDEKSCCGRMQKGDIAIIELSNQLPKNSLVAVSYKNGPVFFRYYARLGTTVILSSDVSYDNITYDISCEDYKILGKVISFNAKL